MSLFWNVVPYHMVIGAQHFEMLSHTVGHQSPSDVAPHVDLNYGTAKA